MENQRIRSLDGLRGIFAAIVMFGHFFLLTTYYPNGQPYFQNLALAVQFFFILSGVALGCGMGRRLISGELSFWNFTRQRLARLYPMHLLSMGAAGLFIGQIYGAIPTGGNFPLETVANLLLLQAVNMTTGWSWNVVSWSISTEFWVGLLVLPFAVRRLPPAIALLLAILGYAVIFLTVHTFERPLYPITPFLNLATVSTAAGLLAGVAVYKWLGLRSSAKKASGFPATALAEAVMLALILATIIWGKRGYQEVIALACMPLLIYLAASSGSILNRALSSQPLNWLGSVSYSLYLIHLPVLGALKMVGIDALPLLPRFAIMCAVSLAAAYVFARYVEVPLYRRLRGPRNASSATVAAIQ